MTLPQFNCILKNLTNTGDISKRHSVKPEVMMCTEDFTALVTFMIFIAHLNVAGINKKLQKTVGFLYNQVFIMKLKFI